MARHGETRERILGATVRTLAAEGFGGTTARAIGRTGGFAAGVIYYYFEDLDDLLLATLHHSSELRLRRYTEALAAPAGAVELLARLRGLYTEDLAEGHVSAVQELISGASGSPRLRDGIRPYAEQWEDFAAETTRRLIAGTPFEGLLPRDAIGTLVISLFLGLQTLTHLDREQSRAAALFDAAEPLAALWDAAPPSAASS